LPRDVVLALLQAAQLGVDLGRLLAALLRLDRGFGELVLAVCEVLLRGVASGNDLAGPGSEVRRGLDLAKARLLQ